VSSIRPEGIPAAAAIRSTGFGGTLRTRLPLLNSRQPARLNGVFADDDHLAVPIDVVAQRFPRLATLHEDVPSLDGGVVASAASPIVLSDVLQRC
jgi:hypothetical protein